jgi:hypothetical protein
LPEKMDLNLKNIQVNLDGKFFSLLEQMAAQSAEQSGQTAIPFSNIDSLGCGDIEKFQLVDYRLMGMRRINADLNLHLGFDKIGEVFSIQIDAITRGIYDVNMAMNIKVPRGEMRNMADTKKIPPMRLSINDTGFYKMRNTYCATSNDSSIDEYVDRHIQLLGETLGLKLPEKIASAYRNHMLKGGRINISVKPQNDISPEELAYYKPLEVAELLGLKVSIGTTRVELDQLFDANSPAVVAKKPTDNTSTTKERKKAATRPTATKQVETKPAVKRITYHVERVENAEKHLDKMVEVTLPGNKVRRGLLEQVRNGRLYLVMQLQGGSITYPVRTTEISKFRVRY